MNSPDKNDATRMQQAALDRRWSIPTRYDLARCVRDARRENARFKSRAATTLKDSDFAVADALIAQFDVYARGVSVEAPKERA